MGTDIKLEEILLERKLELNSILEELDGWDRSFEMAIEIIDICGEKLNKIKILNLKLLKFNQSEIIDKDYELKVLEIIDREKEIIDFIRLSQEEVFSILEELSRKNEIAASYILKNMDPMFIDKTI